jgi:UDP-N-acetylmuramate: L-alanyl-gamma-D-glutamyl-meso-diaminopimelate ligase
MRNPNNRIPDGVGHIHLIAVCGSGMAALAALLKDLGHQVTGSDQNVYPPMSDFLRQKGIAILDGYRKEHVSPDADLVVVGNAVSKDNPEARRTFELGLPFCSMPQALNRFAGAGKKTLLVTGTHGKTTTASILAWVLHAAGLDPSFFIGGLVHDFGSNYRLGSGEYFVVEGDEYDTAFFDKGPKFLHYQPEVTILTSLEFDHADIYRDLEHVKTAFGGLLSTLKAESLLVAFDGNEDIDGLLGQTRALVERYGERAASLWRLGRTSCVAGRSSFEVVRSDQVFGEFEIGMIGKHNLLNSLAVLATTRHLGLPTNDAAKALRTFRGIRRRQEIRGCRRGITVIDDFAHHPTAVRETIAAVKASYGDRRLIAVFEPRTNTSMRSVFQSVYPQMFDLADRICIREPALIGKIPLGERFSSKQLVQDLRKRGKDAQHFQNTDALLEDLVSVLSTGDIVLIMSNGGFDNIHQRLLDSL